MTPRARIIRWIQESPNSLDRLGTDGRYFPKATHAKIIFDDASPAIVTPAATADRLCEWLNKYRVPDGCTVLAADGVDAGPHDIWVSGLSRHGLPIWWEDNGLAHDPFDLPQDDCTATPIEQAEPLTPDEIRAGLDGPNVTAFQIAIELNAAEELADFLDPDKPAEPEKPTPRFERGQRVWNIRGEWFGTCVGGRMSGTGPIACPDGKDMKLAGSDDDCYLPASEAPVPKPKYVATYRSKSDEKIYTTIECPTPTKAIWISCRGGDELIALFALSADGTRFDRIPDEAVQAIRERGEK